MKYALLMAMVVVACGDKQAAPVALGEPAKPFGLLANVSLGMTIDELKQKAPGLKYDANTQGARAYPEGASYDVDLRDGKVVKFRIQVFKRSPDELVKAWGPGTFAARDGDRRHYYSADRTTRADVNFVASGDSFAITWIPMQPLASLLGEGTDATTLLGVKLLDRPLAEVVSDLNKRGYDCEVHSKGNRAHCMDVPAIEVSMGDSGKLTMDAGDGGTVRHIHLFWSPDSVDTAKQFVLDAYKRKWGEPKLDRGYLVYAEHPRVYATPDHASLSVDAVAR